MAFRGTPERLMPVEASGRKTKIVCTVGPASDGADTLARMIEAGMDVARINTGHCEDTDQMRRYLAALEEASVATGRRVGVMLDLQGPRLRAGKIAGSGAVLRDGEEFVITTEQVEGDSSRVSVAHPGLPAELKPGDCVLMDDGLIRLVVKSVSGPNVLCEVLEGGYLREGKGMNFPGAVLGVPSFTERDRLFLEDGLNAGAEWVAQSFVRGADDIRALRGAIEALGYNVPIMAKVEKREAVTNIDSVIEEAQGVMVARGDLGVEMGAEEVPLVQKDIIEKSVRAARPVVTATQMLESMVEKPRPTRAEASDVANAILDGTDAVMLSAETAVGSYPVRAVETMRRIAARTERALDYARMLEERGLWAHRGAAEAIGYAACKIAADLGARAIITVTRRGYTARLVARYRPRARILAVCPDEDVVDGMSVVWGVEGLLAPLAEGLGETVEGVTGECRRAGLVEPGDLVVITGGFLDERAGTTNTITVRTVE